MKKKMRTKKEGFTYGIYIAGTPPKSVRKLERAVLEVLLCSAGDDIKKEALKVMTAALCLPVSINNCTVGASDN